MGLHPEYPGQGVYDVQPFQLQKTAHHRRDVARVAYGHEQDLAGHVPVVPLGHLEGVGLLPQNTPRVLGVEQSHPVVVGQMLHHLHAVVEHAGNLQHHRPAAQGLGQLLRRDLALGKKHHGADGTAHIGRIQGGRGGGVPSGGAHREHLVPAMGAHLGPQITEGHDHAPVLEGPAGVLAVVLEGQRRAHLPGQGRTRLDYGSFPLPQVDDVLFLQHRGHEFVIAEHAAQAGALHSGPGVEQGPPLLAGGAGQGVELHVLEQKHPAAMGTGIEQFTHIETGPAAQTDIFQASAMGRKRHIRHWRILSFLLAAKIPPGARHTRFGGRSASAFPARRGFFGAASQRFALAHKVLYNSLHAPHGAFFPTIPDDWS